MNTVRMRLTLISAVVMLAVAGLVFLVVYTQLRQSLNHQLDAAIEGEWHEFQSIYKDGGIDALEKELGFEQHVLGADGGFMRMYDGAKLDVPSGDLKSWGNVTVPQHVVSNLRETIPILDYAQGEYNGVRVRRLHGLVAPRVGVVMAYSMEEDYHVLAVVRNRFALIFICISLPILLGSWLLARHTMRGVEAVTRTAVEIASGRLDRRVEVVGKGRELVDLANAFNTMLEHLSKVFREIRETNDNIAHDLRTPITRIRAASEALLLDPDASESTHKQAAEAVAECDSLLLAVNTMLDISEMELGVRKPNMMALDLEHLIEESCDLFAPALAERGIRMSYAGNGPVNVCADRQLLRRAICNVLDNAVKYSDQGGDLRVAVFATGRDVEIRLEDTGCGIAPLDLPHVFDRFFRGDKARSQSGSGLGLGLVRAIVTAHGGDVTLSSKLNEGTTVRIRLPIQV